MSNFEFAYPAFFYALLLLPAMIGWYIWRGRKSTSSMTLSGFENLDERVGTSRIWLRHMLFVFRMLVITLIIIVLARPQSSNRWEKITTEGIDIVMCMDVSGSMRAMDFKPNNRLYVAKEEIKKFVRKRTSDRIGLVIFSKSSFTQCPLTLDYSAAELFLDAIDTDLIPVKGTAIGEAIRTSVRAFEGSSQPSRAIILITDGEDLYNLIVF